MKKVKLIFQILLLLLVSNGCSEKKKKAAKKEEVRNEITLSDNSEAKKVDVFVNGKLFTSYLYASDISVLKKTTLYPIIAANGEVVTRGFPLATRANERTDHPHHIGAWFNYGDVNGLDYWGNSDAMPEEMKDKLGTIRHDKIVELNSGFENASMTVTTNWLKPDGKTLLKEETTFNFYAEDGKRFIDRIVTLKALDEQVVFKDTKEGMLAIRVARQLEYPSDALVSLSDAHGKLTDVPVLDNNGVNGHYLSSEGVEGTDVWGKRAKWVALSGMLTNNQVTLVIMDEPNNVGYPTYWHARGYGLFAANALGQHTFSNGKERLNLTLEPSEEITFKYRIAILDGIATKEQIASEYDRFAGK